MTATTLTRLDTDLRERLHPSREQLRVAAAMFRVATEDITSVVVPVVAALADDLQPEGVHPDVDGLEYPGGYWLADRCCRDGAYSFRAARDAAEATAQAHLSRRGGHGCPGWVSIRPDGSWSALDGA